MPKKAQDSEQQQVAATNAADEATPKKTRRIGWAELLARVFAIDMKHCPSCGSDNFKPVAAIMEISAVRKILVHLGLPDKPPDIAPARLHQMSFV